MRLLLSLIIAITLVEGMPRADDELWREWKQKYNKSYTVSEEVTRHAIWKEHLAKIEAHNVRYESGLETFKEGLNQFHDLTFDEFRRMYLTAFNLPSTGGINAAEFKNKHAHYPLPSSFDWRNLGYVTAVKNQGDCGCCYAFASTGALEGQWKNKSGELVSLSEQQLVDCSRAFGNSGCFGGMPEYSYSYVQVFGIESETTYPYVGMVSTCHYNISKTVFKSKSWLQVQTTDEEILQIMVTKFGPISVAIHASEAFKYYESGILNNCASEPVNHAVLVVGYGTEKGQDYWILKNSWGADWGESGYIRIARNAKNTCGIGTWQSVPIL